MSISKRHWTPRFLIEWTRPRLFLRFRKRVSSLLYAIITFRFFLISFFTPKYDSTFSDAFEKKVIEVKKKRKFEMPDESGVHFVKQKKIKEMSTKSSSALAFREQMMGRHNRQSIEARKREKEKKKFMRK